MSSTNLYSFIFAGVLFTLVFFGHSETDRQTKLPSYASEIEKTSVSLVADIKTQVDAIAESLPINENKENSLVPFPIESPKVKISAGLVQELDSEQPLFSYRAEQRWPIASLTKLMTAVIAYEKINKETLIPVSQEAVATEGIGGGLSAGEKVSARKLVELMMVVSSNDAAAALAEYIGKNAFVDAMQAKAAELGMIETAFFNESGLSTLNQSTILDLKKLINYIYRTHPEILELSTQVQVSHAGQTLKNINAFAGQSDFLGGKTGFLEESRGNLLTLFKIHNRVFLFIVFGAENRFEQTEILHNWAESLF